MDLLLTNKMIVTAPFEIVIGKRFRLVSASRNG